MERQNRPNLAYSSCKICSDCGLKCYSNNQATLKYEQLQSRVSELLYTWGIDLGGKINLTPFDFSKVPHQIHVRAKDQTQPNAWCIGSILPQRHGGLLTAQGTQLAAAQNPRTMLGYRLSANFEEPAPAAVIRIP
ncbi:hypothetical protein UY3_10975 [Chelonia mydas]|uniref:Uncharacterized protein n=1 Tax=Chelonia mydas TaxID=8469 RepID=M7BUU1_CHEMY|nr:hypothetical protein UY3_10975 [Chelonia mydas]